MVNSATATQSKTRPVKRWFRPSWRHFLTGGFLIYASLVAAANGPVVQRWERQLQTFFFDLRGPQVAPENIVILAIDEESKSQGEHYKSEPEKYAAMEPIKDWPWPRQAYAIAIEKLMQSGAKAVALDVVFSADSEDPANDQALAAVLEQYGDRVTLATIYEEQPMRQGFLLKPILPLAQFRDTGAHLGIINFLVEPNGRIHRQGHNYLTTLERSRVELDPSSPTAPDWDSVYSFAEATLNAARVEYDTSGTDINFLGPTRTFRQIPFWYVIDPDPWNNYLDSGEVFKDKIVLIGATAKDLQDFDTSHWILVKERFRKGGSVKVLKI
ncbi:MAG: CHASE2 domain-containing protein, partial [Cyanobacteria bacterium J06626_18]